MNWKDSLLWVLGTPLLILCFSVADKLFNSDALDPFYAYMLEAMASIIFYKLCLIHEELKK